MSFDAAAVTPHGTNVPDIRSKVAKYFVNQKLQELDSTNPQIKLDAGDFLQALPAKLKAATAESSQQPDILPLPYGETADWKNLYKIFSERAERAELPEIFPAKLFPWFRVAIIGGGVAGLRTAKLLQDNGIPYKIFEASKRPGGRVFTYPFSPKTPAGHHDYYDVGAMRFPDNEASKRTFELFKELKLEKKLIPYVFSRDNAIMYYNGIKSTAAVASTKGDHFKDETVPKEYLNKTHVDLTGKTIYGVDACIYAAYDPFRKALVKDFDQGWKKLMEHDRASTRSYLTYEEQYPIPVAHWLETRASGTGGFDCAFSEAILESLEFNYPIKEGVKWKCLDGGSEVLIGAMLNQLDTQPSYNQRVTSVRSIIEKPPNSWPFDRFPFMKVNSVDDSTGKQHSELFSHVISTTTMAALSTIDTTGVHMTYTQRQAIRSLLYGAAVKVGIKFTSRWWEKKNGADQRGASSYTDRLSRVVVYPSAGIGEDGPGVLMVTYNWNQDASRFGSLIKNPDWSEQLDPDRTRPRSEKQLLDLIYQDLAVLHGVSADQLRTDTLDYHVFDWYHNPYTMGAYAHFGPGQFSTLWPDIVQPAGYGRFHFAGELASANHAWVAGALDSAVRVVNEILSLDFPMLLSGFIKAQGRSSMFSNDVSAFKYLVKGLVSRELEEAEARRV